MLQRILVPTDFSATADAALDYAYVLAERFGASIELLQGLTAYRTAEWLDLLADAVGLALAAWPCSLALRRHLA